MVAVPAPAPVTTPDAEPTVAAPLLVQVPPDAVSVSVMLAPAHTVEGPDIAGTYIVELKSATTVDEFVQVPIAAVTL